MQKIKKSKMRRILFVLGVLLLLALSISSALSWYLRGIALYEPTIHRVENTEVMVNNSIPMQTKNIHRNKNLLTVMSFNLAHGRKDGMNQLLLKKAKIQKNLQDISEVLKKVNADVIALQEADGPSFWSGDFNHVAFLARHLNMQNFIQGEHVRKMSLSYGTGLLSHYPLTESMAVTFAASPPTTPKGFLLGSIQWGQHQIDVISLHLDFLRPAVRERQIQKLIGQLQKRHNPVIIMGDFNSDWFQSNSALRLLVKKLDLKVWQPESRELATFRLTNKRLDWIVISKELKFHSYRILPDIISDHASIVAEVAYADLDKE